MGRYTVELKRSAQVELNGLPAFDYPTVRDAIDEQLSDRPAVEEGHKSPLDPPIGDLGSWRLRVGDWRVYYDVDQETMTVTVNAIRLKPNHATTEDIL